MKHIKMFRLTLATLAIVLTGGYAVAEDAVLPEGEGGMIETPSGAVTYTWTGAGDGTNWTQAANWSPSGVPGANDTVNISGGSVYVESSVSVADLTVEEGASLYVNATGSVYRAVSKSESKSILNVTGGVKNSGSIVVGGVDNAGGSYVTIGGDLIMNGKGVFSVYAGHTVDNPTPLDYKTGGGSLSVAGDIKLNDSSRIYPCVAPTWGFPVVITAKDVFIGPSARITTLWTESNYAYSKGWASATAPGYSSAGTSGGSYGGLGGHNNSGKPKTYGFEKAPFYAGSPGRSMNGLKGHGGGAIRLHCDNVRLEGGLYVKGGNNSATGKAAGSGGSIWVTCATFTVSETAVLDASGGNATQHTSSYAGGGGRIAIFDGSPSEEQINSLYETGECVDAVVASTDFNDYASPLYGAKTSVAGGYNYEYDDNPTSSRHGKPGTMVYMRNIIGKHVLTIAGAVGTVDTSPKYGVYALDPGIVSLSCFDFWYDPENPLRRIPCIGYEWYDSIGGYGYETDLEVEINVESDTYFIWLFGVPQYYIDVKSGGYGSISWDGEAWRDEGTTVTLTANPHNGAKFLYWVGDVDASQRYATTIVLPVDRARSVVACFANNSNPRNLVWTGAGDGSGWFDPKNWDGVAVPGPQDSVSISSGKAVISNPSNVELASLQLSGTAMLYFGAEPSMTELGATISYPAFEVTEGISLSVSGDVALSGKSSMVCGGWGADFEFDFRVGGSLSLSDTARLFMYAGYKGRHDELETFYTGGARVSVGRDFLINGKSAYYPACNFRSGAPVVTTVGGRLFVDSSASVNSNYRGWGHEYEKTTSGYKYTFYGYGTYNGFGYSGYKSDYSRVGGSYGGESYDDGKVNVYGSKYVPYYPGSSGYTDYESSAVKYQVGGGGAIRIHAAKMEINGTLSANGYGDYCYAGGSGGGIFLTARSVKLGANAKLSAKGGGGGTYQNTKSGGGGRIAIALRLRPEQIARLYREETLPGIKETDMTVDPAYTAHIDVSGGKGKYPGNTAYYAGSGTAVIYTANNPFYIIVR